MSRRRPNACACCAAASATARPEPGCRRLEQQIAEQAVAVAAARLDLVARLARVLAAAEGPFPRPALALAGEVEGWLEEMPALAAEERLRERLARNRGLDAEAGRALVGPHRTDLAARFAATGMPAGDCSTGEQKALIIAILLGQARLMAEKPGRLPILLLDEIAAHLDESRRRALFEALLESRRPGLAHRNRARPVRALRRSRPVFHRCRRAHRQELTTGQ